MNLRKIRKAIGALLGGVTGAVIIAIAGAFGLGLAPELAAAIALILASIGAWIAPPNEETMQV